MPVVTLYYNRFIPMLGGKIDKGTIIDRLPYLGLDIEDQEDTSYVKVEYNPNRPDYSTDCGIARGFRGLLGIEIGAPKYSLRKEGVSISVEEEVKGIRPFIVGLNVRELSLDEESLRQLISMQEDLHAGIGRQRRRVSVGLHNADVIEPPFRYIASEPSFRFTPLGEKDAMSMGEALQRTEQGRKYGHLVSNFNLYPLLLDAKGNVLSFPPIINGELTRVTPSTKNLLVDVTGTELKAVEDALAIITATLSDMGGKLEQVTVHYKDRTMKTPDMAPSRMKIDLSMARRLLGLRLRGKEAIEALSRCRLDVKGSGSSLTASIPRYRIDIMHPVDLIEEIAIGFGIDKFQPTLPQSSISGRRERTQTLMDLSREVLVGLGLTEIMSFSLVDENLLYGMVNRKPSFILRVESPKSKEHEVLRDSLIPSALSALSANIQEDYPQRLFEIARVFVSQNEKFPVKEEYHIGVVFAHSKTNFTEAKSYLVSFLSQAFDLACETRGGEYPTLSSGRSAAIDCNGVELGNIGEVDPQVLERFGIRVPVSCFELSLTGIRMK